MATAPPRNWSYEECLALFILFDEQEARVPAYNEADIQRVYDHIILHKLGYSNIRPSASTLHQLRIVYRDRRQAGKSIFWKQIENFDQPDQAVRYLHPLPCNKGRIEANITCTLQQTISQRHLERARIRGWIDDARRRLQFSPNNAAEPKHYTGWTVLRCGAPDGIDSSWIRCSSSMTVVDLRIEFERVGVVTPADRNVRLHVNDEVCGNARTIANLLMPDYSPGEVRGGGCFLV
jgi:hypothetical protein